MTLVAGVRLGPYEVLAPLGAGGMSACGDAEARPVKPSRGISVSTRWGWGPRASGRKLTPSPGARLGPYEIVSALGAGGMGEVYRARDPRLGRDVAIKVLPAVFSADPERLTRFEQEAQAAAALSHPNILAVYDIGQHDSAPYIVSELLEGETLRERLNAGPLPGRRAVEFAVQIAHGLAAAHEKAIVHRDLKPENLFITSDGRVKILDFGLAKLTQPDLALAGASALPTTPPITQAGLILGTIGYMAPEQVRGLVADHRSDIFAFGAVLYEMLAGQRAFRGDTPMDTMTAILKEDPPELRATDRQIPLGLERIIHRCLEKSAVARFQSAGDVAFALEGLSGSSAVDGLQQAVGGKSSRVAWSIAVASAAIAAAALAAGTYVYWVSEAPSTVRFAFTVPEGKRFGEGPNLALSPDGSRIVYQALDEHGVSALYIRPVDSLDSQPLAGTERGFGPFFSPDGQWVGFFADRKLKKIAVGGGVPIELADAPNSRGGSWGTDGTIVFTPDVPSGIFRVSADGGTPTPMTTLDSNNLLDRHNWPELLPGARAVLFSENTGGDWADADIVVLSLETGERRVLIHGGSHARYISGHLVYASAGGLLAIPFDLQRLEVTGEAVPVVKDVPRSLVNGGARFNVSASGALAYVPGSVVQDRRTLAWVDRKGMTRSVGEHQTQRYETVSLSPDGRRLAVGIGAALQGDVWAYDLARAILTRVTSDSLNASPIWTLDGKRMIYWKGDLASAGGLFWIAGDGSGHEERLYEYDRVAFTTATAPGAWSPDGRVLVFTIDDAATRADIWTLALDGDRPAKPFIRTPFLEGQPALSPEGRWIAYISNFSGREEVYVQPFPSLAERWQISADGGTEPRWAPNGRELFYRNGARMMAVDIRTQPTFQPQTARVLFERSDMAGTRSYDVAPDGEQFVIIKQDESTRPLTEAHVVIGWAEEIKRRTATR